MSLSDQIKAGFEAVASEVANIRAGSVSYVVITDDPDLQRPDSGLVIWVGGTERPSRMIDGDIWYSEIPAPGPEETAPEITTASLDSLTQGAAFSQTLAATGTAPITWSATGLPVGVSLTGATISGTPSASGAYSVTITAANAAGTDSQVFTGTVASSGTAPTITTASISPMTAGSVYSQAIAATGSTPRTWGVSAGSLPPGIGINSSTGALSGTPTTTGSYTFTLQATNAFGSDTQEFTVAVSVPNQTARSTGTTGSTSYTRYEIALAGDPAIVYVPNALALNTAASVLAVAHGSNDDQGLVDREAAETRDFALDLGWIVVSADAGGDTAGNSAALTAWESMFNWVEALWNIDEITLYGASMGSLTFLNYISHDRAHVGQVTRFVGIDSPYDLEAMYGWSSYFQGLMEAAYGFSGSANVVSALGTYDPATQPVSAWSGIRYFLAASPNDTALPAEFNTQSFVTLLETDPAIDVTVLDTSGVHYAPENFAPDEVNTWLTTAPPAAAFTVLPDSGTQWTTSAAADTDTSGSLRVGNHFYGTKTFRVLGMRLYTPASASGAVLTESFTAYAYARDWTGGPMTHTVASWGSPAQSKTHTAARTAGSWTTVLFDAPITINPVGAGVNPPDVVLLSYQFSSGNRYIYTGAWTNDPVEAAQGGGDVFMAEADLPRGVNNASGGTNTGTWYGIDLLWENA